ncbi:MAG: transposase [bacterium]|nr:transposase [bacterium]
MPLSFSIASANHHDVKLVWDVVDHCWNIFLMGDKGYIDKKQEDDLKRRRNITLLTPKRKNQKEQNSRWLNSFISKSRKIIETVFSQLTDQFNISKNRAKVYCGLISRVVRKMTAYTIGIYINKLLGRPLLEIKSLVF